jgi:hypothetical protein
MLCACACTLGLTPLAFATTAVAGSAHLAATKGGALKDGVSATVEQCVPAPTQQERSVTFAGEMTTIPGSARMEMRIDLLELGPSDAAFRTVSAPGLGVWRTAAAGVKVYKYVKQVTNLYAPATYRAAVRFRWLDSKGRLLKVTEHRTPVCQQPSRAAETGTPPAGASEGTSSSGAGGTSPRGASAGTV